MSSAHQVGLGWGGGGRGAIPIPDTQTLQSQFHATPVNIYVTFYTLLQTHAAPASTYFCYTLGLGSSPSPSTSTVHQIIVNFKIVVLNDKYPMFDDLFCVISI